MRLFRIDAGKRFVEYKVQDFKSEHLEEDLESLLEENPDSLFEDEGLLILSRQVSTNFKTFLDILGLDRSGNTVIVELKRDRTPREVIAQALEYASFIEGLDYPDLERILQSYMGNNNESLTEYHRAFFELDEGESISFNKDQRIVIVGSRISPEVRQQAIFLNRKGLQVYCVEFSYFRTQSGEQLLSTDVIIGKEHLKPEGITTGALQRIDRETFLSSVNGVGRPVFKRILDVAEEQGFPIHWGGKGFSLNMEVEGKDVALCYGYPPHAVYRQSVYTAFADIIKKIRGGEDVVEEFKGKITGLGYFVRAGNEVKWVLGEAVPTQSIDDLITILLEMGETLRQHGLARETAL